MAEGIKEAPFRLRRPIAFLYPPQPLEPCPMPEAFFAQLPRLADLHNDALRAIGWDAMTRYNGTVKWPRQPRSAQQVRGAQIGVVAFSWAMTQMLAEAAISPDVIFGHSLGLHSALAASGATRITDTLEVVDRTAQFLAKKQGKMSGSMLAVIGFTPTEIAELCERIEPPATVFPAIINSRRQIVVSGEKGSVERLAKELQAKQAWGLTPIPGRLPLHTPLMAPVADRCAALTAGMRCHVPHVRLIHPTTGENVYTASGVDLLWRTHLLRMIDFVLALQEMEKAGVRTYIEVGAGETLTRLGRWFRRDLPILSTGQPEILEEILHAGVE